MRELISAESAGVFSKVAAELRAAEGISFTSDGWSARHRTFFAVTATFLDDKFVMQSRVLDLHQFEDNHNSSTMSAMMLATLRRAGIDCSKIVSLVGDAASSQQSGMEKVWQSIDPSLTTRVWCRCLAHMVQTCVRNALGASDPFLADLRDLIDYVKAGLSII